MVYERISQQSLNRIGISKSCTDEILTQLFEYVFIYMSFILIVFIYRYSKDKRQDKDKTKTTSTSTIMKIMQQHQQAGFELNIEFNDIIHEWAKICLC